MLLTTLPRGLYIDGSLGFAANFVYIVEITVENVSDLASNPVNRLVM